MKVLHTTICEKIDRAASNVAQVQKSASVIKKSEQDLELKKKQVSKAIESGKLFRNKNEMRWSKIVIFTIQITYFYIKMTSLCIFHIKLAYFDSKRRIQVV